jgi:cobaltochelatase CobN
MDKIGRKIVMILANDRGRNGLDTPQSAINMLHTLKADGYRVEDIPADGDALMHALQAANGEETFPRGDYGMYFATLPRTLQDSVNKRWGAPERDHSFRESRLDCGAFAIRAIRCGNVVAAVEPPRSDDFDSQAGQDSRDLPPTHGYLAFYAWIADGIRAHGIVHLSNKRRPEAAFCTVPQLA